VVGEHVEPFDDLNLGQHRVFVGLGAAERADLAILGGFLAGVQKRGSSATMSVMTLSFMVGAPDSEFGIVPDMYPNSVTMSSSINRLG
jgi:hypothetical protein